MKKRSNIRKETQTMSEKTIQLNEEAIKGELRELVRESVEETLNGLLEAEAEKPTQAARYERSEERSEERRGYRSGHYDRNLTTTSGEVTLHGALLSKRVHGHAALENEGYRPDAQGDPCAGEPRGSKGKSACGCRIPS
jgi:hypothetical protein